MDRTRFPRLLVASLLLSLNLVLPFSCQNSSDSEEIDSSDSTTVYNSSVDHETLRAVILIFNEGLSTPPSTYSYIDPYLRPEFWPDGVEQLTSTGKSQLFNLGKRFHQRYSRFLTGSPREVSARSGDKDNNIEGALVFLHGAYKARGHWKYSSTDYLPIAVHTVPKKDDCVLSTHCNCPLVNNVIAELLSSSECDDLKKQFESTLKLVESKTGLNSFWKQIDYVETVLLQVMLKSPIPSWITPGVVEDFDDLANGFHSMATAFPSMLKQMVGPIYSELTEQFKVLLAPSPRSSTKQKPRLLLYSTLTPISASVAYHLAGVNGAIPPPGSIFFIELYEEPGLTYAVKLAYWNDTDAREPDPLTPTFGSSLTSSTASLDDLLSHMSELMESDWSAYCGSVESGLDTLSIILIVILCIVFAIVAFTVFTIVKKSRSGYVIFK